MQPPTPILTLPTRIQIAATGFAAAVLEGTGQPRSITIAAFLASLMIQALRRTLHAYRATPYWAELSSHDQALLIATDLVSLASLGTWIDSFNHADRASVGPHLQLVVDDAAAPVAVHDRMTPRQRQVEAAIVGALHHHRLVGTTGHLSFKAALAWHVTLYSRIARQQIEGLCGQLFSTLFPIAMLVGSPVAATHVVLAIREKADPTFILLLVATTLTLLFAGIAHFRQKTPLHQLAMVGLGLSVLSMSIYLWRVDTGFTSEIPDLAGRIAGVGFGAAIVVWQFFAFRDPKGISRRCNIGAFTAASFGATLIALNVADRILARSYGASDIASVAWSLCIVGGATLAAIARKEWLTGSRDAAVNPRPTDERQEDVVA